MSAFTPEQRKAVLECNPDGIPQNSKSDPFGLTGVLRRGLLGLQGAGSASKRVMDGSPSQKP